MDSVRRQSCAPLSCTSSATSAVGLIATLVETFSCEVVTSELTKTCHVKVIPHPQRLALQFGYGITRVLTKSCHFVIYSLHSIFFVTIDFLILQLLIHIIQNISSNM
jgi:hypothetical protein